MICPPKQGSVSGDKSYEQFMNKTVHMIFKFGQIEIRRLFLVGVPIHPDLRNRTSGILGLAFLFINGHKTSTIASPWHLQDTRRSGLLSEQATVSKLCKCVPFKCFLVFFLGVWFSCYPILYCLHTGTVWTWFSILITKSTQWLIYLYVWSLKVKFLNFLFSCVLEVK